MIVRVPYRYIAKIDNGRGKPLQHWAVEDAAIVNVPSVVETDLLLIAEVPTRRKSAPQRIFLNQKDGSYMLSSPSVSKQGPPDSLGALRNFEDNVAPLRHSRIVTPDKLATKSVAKSTRGNMLQRIARQFEYDVVGAHNGQIYHRLQALFLYKKQPYKGKVTVKLAFELEGKDYSFSEGSRLAYRRLELHELATLQQEVDVNMDFALFNLDKLPEAIKGISPC